MHALLEAIYTTQTVTDGKAQYSALNPEGHPTYIDRAEGALLQRAIAAVRPTTTLEIGMAYGVSTLFMCEALAELPHRCTHIAIDPYQNTKWHGIGLRNASDAGFAELLRFFEERSEFCLPRLVQEGTTIQVALIDGRHLFEQCALEFYFIDRMLPVGGTVIFDDVDWPAIRRVVRLAMSYGTYEVTDHTGPKAGRRSLLGRVRKALTQVPHAEKLLRPDFIVRDHELGIRGTCVALKKISPERRKYREYREF
jgi:predicted O-methyltransferase YrrM